MKGIIGILMVIAVMYPPDLNGRRIPVVAHSQITATAEAASGASATASKKAKKEKKKKKKKEGPSWFEKTFNKLSNEIFSDDDMK